MRPTVAFILGMLLVACGGDRGDGVPVPEDGDSVLLTVTSEGGFVPLEFNLERMPRFVLLGDRTLYYQGPTTMEFPGPLLPNVQETAVPEDLFGEVLMLIEELGLPEMDTRIDEDGAEMVADASTELITYYDDQGAHRFGAVGLGLIEGGSTERILARELVEALEQAAASAGSVPHRAERLQVAAGPPVDTEGMGSIQPWPLSVDFGEMDPWMLEWRCVEITGDEVDTLLAVFESANRATLWETDGETYSIRARPLLPSETACQGVPESG